MTLYDAGVRLPLIVRQPGNAAGIVKPNLISFLDISPTCVDWVGIQHTQVSTGNTNYLPVRLESSFVKILDNGSWLPSE